MIDKVFWTGRRVFLTGHTGFKGSWLSLWLRSIGAHVTGYALNPPTTPSLFVEASVADDIESIIGDVRDYPRLLESMRAANPEIVIHMAAQPLVRHSYDDPIETYGINVMGTVNVLEAVRSVGGVRAIVNVTTDKCYENNEWEWGYRESDRLGGYDPYSNSKACAELVSSAYRQSFFNPEAYARHGVALATARAGNVIGGGDWATDRLVPDLVRAFTEGRPAEIRNPRAIRPWQHVLEPLGGYLLLAQNLATEGVQYGEAWNFGPVEDGARPVGQVATELAGLWGRNARWIDRSDGGPHEANYLKLDFSRARTRLGWQPQLDLSQSLALTAQWFTQRASGADVRVLTQGQIAQYVSKFSK